jgi:hypothetical protein
MSGLAHARLLRELINKRRILVLIELIERSVVDDSDAIIDEAIEDEMGVCLKLKASDDDIEKIKFSTISWQTQCELFSWRWDKQ